MKTTISLLQGEIEEAIRVCIRDRVQPGYRYEFAELDVDFDTAPSGTVSCTVTTTVDLKVEKQHE